MARLVPELRDRLPNLAPPSTMEPGQARFRLFDGVTTLLRNAARRQPLLVVLDDLHRADASSLLLLEFLARELRRAAILVVGTYRALEVGPEHTLFGTLATLVREPATRQLALSGLLAGDLARYVETATGSAPTDALVSEVAEQTGGNPFFAGEVVRLLAAQASSAPAAVAHDVHTAVALRLEPLSGACRDLLRLAAVVGRDVGLDLLESAGALSRSACSSCSTRP